MRHGKKINHLSRKYGHRKAMLTNMSNSLIEHKRIFTTVAKAKELRKFIEPLITKAKTDTTHNRRVVFSYLQNKEAVKTLFMEIGAKVAERPGGYTRILKTHNRQGDNAEMCMIELVDYNELMLEATEKKKAGKTSGKKRSRRGGKKKSSSTAAKQTSEAKEETKVEEPKEEKVEEVKAEANESTADSTDEASEETTNDSEEKKDA
jgi:large subunit ribosomal protein L17